MMLLKLFLIVLLSTTQVVFAQDCPQNSFFVNEVTSCIHPDNDISSMAFAELYCEAFGGHLLSIHNTFYNSLLTGIQLTRLNGNRGFLGAKRLTNGTWSWSDGTPFDYVKWAKGEPSTGDCAYLDSDDYYWKSVDCSTSLPYLCALPNITMPDCTTPPPNPISCPKGSRYIDEIQSCLHADNNVVSFFLAEKYCQAYNGHLFSIHDGDTDDFLTGVSFTLITGDQFYIGGMKNASSYAWTDGSPFDYSNWAASEPPFDCVVIQRETASWVTVNCSTALSFMCNIPPILNGGCTTTFVPLTIEMETTTAVPPPSMDPLNCLPVQSQPLYNCYKGWQYFPGTGYYYLIFFNSTFSQGEAYCVSQGGHLASIHSQAEDDFITGLCCDADCDTRSFVGYTGLTLIGGHKVNGAWTWSDGSPWDYQPQICEDGGSPFLWTKSQTDGFGTCEWGAPESDPADAFGVPYFACKRSTP